MLLHLKPVAKSPHLPPSASLYSCSSPSSAEDRILRFLVRSFNLFLCCFALHRVLCIAGRVQAFLELPVWSGPAWCKTTRLLILWVAVGMHKTCPLPMLIMLEKVQAVLCFWPLLCLGTGVCQTLPSSPWAPLHGQFLILAQFLSPLTFSSFHHGFFPCTFPFSNSNSIKAALGSWLPTRTMV